MIYLKMYYRLILGATFMLLLTACNSQQQSGNEQSSEQHGENMEQDSGHGHEGNGHGGDQNHNQEEASNNTSDNTGGMVWTASAGNVDIFNEKLTLLKGSKDKLAPEVISVNSGEKALRLNASKDAAIIGFANDLGNLGAKITFNSANYQGPVKFVYHFQNDSNYDFVTIEGSTMKLGRMQEDQIHLFDEKSFQYKKNRWNTLRLSSAGTHYKGYINGELITHGHSDEVGPGKVGLMIQGKGNIKLIRFEVVPLN